MSRWMNPSNSFTMQAFTIVVFACCLKECFQIGHGLVIPASVTCTANTHDLTRSAKHLAQTDLLPPMRRQKSQTQSQQTERFLSFKCKNCNSEFANLRSYDCHCRHKNAQGSPCSDESNTSEITFSARAGLATGILRQHSLAKLGEWFTFWSNKSNNYQISIK